MFPCLPRGYTANDAGPILYGILCIQRGLQVSPAQRSCWKTCLFPCESLVDHPGALAQTQLRNGATYSGRHCCECCCCCCCCCLPAAPLPAARVDKYLAKTREADAVGSPPRNFSNFASSGTLAAHKQICLPGEPSQTICLVAGL
jgi:hypothetical protein